MSLKISLIPRVWHVVVHSLLSSPPPGESPLSYRFSKVNLEFVVVVWRHAMHDFASKIIHPCKTMSNMFLQLQSAFLLKHFAAFVQAHEFAVTSIAVPTPH